MTDSGKSVFLSYASQDADVAERLCNALRDAGIEVWFDKSELRGGDAWDASIRRQIKGCYLFVPVISANTQLREEGYFRREWNLAVARTLDMAESRAFLLPVVIDGTSDASALVPEKFREVQWTRLPPGANLDPFVVHVRRLLVLDNSLSVAISAGTSALTNASTGRLSPPASGRFVPWILGGILVVAIGYFVSSKFPLSKHGLVSSGPAVSAPAKLETVNDKSIAVLPFTDMSEKHDQEYFGDGMAEEILDLLVKVTGLKVIGRTSSFRFKGKNEDLRNIGEQLGARYLVEGSVRRIGEHLRVTAQLIDANDGTHRWSDTYDRKSGDAVDVQEEISANLVRALQLELDASSLADSHAMTRSGEAYDSYLRGRHALNRNDQHGFEEAIAYFRRALAIDPNFAAASEALAEAKVGMVDEDYVPADIGWEEARKAAQQALILNPHSARAHAILGYTHLVHDWDWGGAQRELEIAMSLTPNDAVVLTHAAQHRMAVGQLPEAALLIEAASAADPLDPYVFSVRLLVYHRQERLTDAVQAGRRALEISPTFSWQHYYLGVVFLDSGNAKAALTEMKQEVHPKAHLVGIADAYWALGQIQQANAALARAEREV